MPKPRHEPVRTCVACRVEAPKAELIRVVRAPIGDALVVDRTGRAPGRGAYVHGSPACLELARKRRQLERALGAAAAPDLWVALGASV